MKICFAASSGGHLEELNQLKELMTSNDSILYTEKTQFENKCFCNDKIFTCQINRKEIFFIFKFIYLFFHSLFVLLKYKPSLIISTGALCTYPLCVVGKLLKMKIIFIESFARVDRPSLTGRLIYKFADLFIIQWPELLEYYPNAILGGSIF